MTLSIFKGDETKTRRKLNVRMLMMIRNKEKNKTGRRRSYTALLKTRFSCQE